MPDVREHPLFARILADVATDVRAMQDVGHDVDGLLAELDAAAAAGSADDLLAFQQRIWNLPAPESYGFDEPGDWDAISATFPGPESHARFRGAEADLADRLHAAWLGRCIGCQLGKPLEGTHWPARIKELLQFVGSWPLTDYMNPVDPDLPPERVPDPVFAGKLPGVNALTRGRFRGAAADDDLLYALVGQLTLERHGPEFTSQQAAETLTQLVPFSSLWASGRNLFRTFVFGLRPPYTALYGNPCPQSLGAQIRCDPWGWGAPANPALAAQMACRDAVNSQVRNGIYSGIFFSVLIADAFAQSDPAAAVETALSYVPPRSRLADVVHFTQAQCAATDDWEAANERIYEHCADCTEPLNHALPNAAICVLGLLMGGGDFTRAIGIAVSAGLDTDCNGATVGSIMGAMLGTAGIAPHWTDALQDTMHTDVKGMPTVSIRETARRMFEVARPNARMA